MGRNVVLLGAEWRQAGDEHEALVALEAADFGGVDEVAADDLVGFRVRATNPSTRSPPCYAP